MLRRIVVGATASRAPTATTGARRRGSDRTCSEDGGGAAPPSSSEEEDLDEADTRDCSGEGLDRPVKDDGGGAARAREASAEGEMPAASSSSSALRPSQNADMVGYSAEEGKMLGSLPDKPFGLPSGGEKARVKQLC